MAASVFSTNWIGYLCSVHAWVFGLRYCVSSVIWANYLLEKEEYQLIFNSDYPSWCLHPLAVRRIVTPAPFYFLGSNHTKGSIVTFKTLDLEILMNVLLLDILESKKMHF
ncbi:hypothetical protein AVEN_241096-1 [Araneus ventricosus]|uniref:Uncharacterized protein n=1 Tax=Araneus ventricosus TaxID=182803 RepID=A0A4Y2T3V7_ARAVE|nr:hypothetical protein AVEN_241096-1 [Araneus ventricosus]